MEDSVKDALELWSVRVKGKPIKKAWKAAFLLCYLDIIRQKLRYSEVGNYPLSQYFGLLG